MLYRYAAALAPVKTPPADALAGFRDKAPAWAADAVAWAVAGDLWFSGSSACLKAGDAVTAPKLETALMALSVGGMPLREDWADGNTAPDVTITVDAVTAGEVRWTLRNSGENWMFFGADSGLYRKVNGGLVSDESTGGGHHHRLFDGPRRKQTGEPCLAGRRGHGPARRGVPRRQDPDSHRLQAGSPRNGRPAVGGVHGYGLNSNIKFSINT